MLIRAIIVAGILALVHQGAAADAVTAEPAVKLSRNGVCHDRTSPNFRQLATYDGYETIEACLQAGGRLPNGARSQPFQPKPANPAWWQEFDWIWGIGMATFFIAVLFPPLRIWYFRRRQRRGFRNAETDARRRWEDHRLDRPGRRR